MKTCKTCGVEKNLDEFSKHPDAKDGYLNQCKLCINEQIRVRRAAKPKGERRKPKKSEKLLEAWRRSSPDRRLKWIEILRDYNAKQSAKSKQRTMKICTICKFVKPLEKFPKNCTSPDGHNTMCIECRKEYDRIRYQTKGASIRARVKLYRKLNLPKVNAADSAKIKNRKRSMPQWLSFIQRAQIEEFYELAAARTMQTGIEHHVDHIVPIKGKNISGLTVPWNLQVLTAQNNLRKHASFTEGK